MAAELDLALVRPRLEGRRIEWHTVTDSTMLRAAELVREGCPNGTAVGADAQTAGMGRHGRQWISEAGSGLYVSIVLRTGMPADRLPLVMLALGLAAQEAIERTAGLRGDLRWPNDILINGRKCAGILAQLEGDAVIAGIGINVNQSAFPEGLDTPATSLRLSGAVVAREDLLVALLSAVDHWMNQPADSISDAFLKRSSYARGRRVRAERDHRIVEGTTVGLDPSGFLIIREDNGIETTILAGGVRPA